MKEFTSINNDRSRVRVFNPFENVSKPIPKINAMEITFLYIILNSYHI